MKWFWWHSSQEKNPKINSHIQYTPKRDSYNSFSSPVYATTSLLDHSYVKLISSYEEILLEDIESLDQECNSSINGEGRNPKTKENFDLH